MIDHGRKRVIIENVAPEIDAGSFPIKRVIGEKVVVSADIFADGHDLVDARLLYRQRRIGEWTEHRMTPEENDRWSGEFSVAEVGIYSYTLEAWIDRFKTWQRDLKKKLDAGQEN